MKTVNIDDVLKILHKYGAYVFITDNKRYSEMQDEIANLPSVQPKTGHWIKTPKAVMGEGYMWYCDKCEHQVYQDSSRDYPSENYCPNCGACMKDCRTLDEFIEDSKEREGT